jgi:hypothetical protein
VKRGTGLVAPEDTAAGARDLAAATPAGPICVGGAGGDVFAFDDMTIGSREQVTPVPEPASIALLLTGLGVFGLTARRRQRQG